MWREFGVTRLAGYAEREVRGAKLRQSTHSELSNLAPRLRPARRTVAGRFATVMTRDRDRRRPRPRM
eukprot:scaffold6176_cov41-Phaeocystis_antarctica.AAC.1